MLRPRYKTHRLSQGISKALEEHLGGTSRSPTPEDPCCVPNGVPGGGGDRPVGCCNAQHPLKSRYWKPVNCFPVLSELPDTTILQDLDKEKEPLGTGGGGRRGRREEGRGIRRERRGKREESPTDEKENMYETKEIE